MSASDQSFLRVRMLHARNEKKKKIAEAASRLSTFFPSKNHLIKFRFVTNLYEILLPGIAVKAQSMFVCLFMHMNFLCGTKFVTLCGGHCTDKFMTNQNIHTMRIPFSITCFVRKYDCRWIRVSSELLTFIFIRIKRLCDGSMTGETKTTLFYAT